MSSTATSTEHYEAPPNGFRTFVIVWITQSVSVFGTALTFFAITIWLTQTLYPRADQKPELALALSALGLTAGLPIVFIAPIAGAWADRHDRKRTMMTMDTANGLLSLTLVALIVTHTLTLWLLLPLVLLLEVFGMFHGSAFDTSYAMIVPEKQLPRANGMMQTIWSLSGILSPVIAATIIALPALARSNSLPGPLNDALRGLSDGTPLAMAVDALTFFIAAATLIFLYIPSPKRSDLSDGTPKKSLLSDVKVGASYIWRRRTLIWLLAAFTVANLAGTAEGVLEPLLVKFNLAADWQAQGMEFAQALGLLGSAAGFGGLVGGLFISAWGGLKKKRVYGVLIPMIFGGLAQVGFGLSTGLLAAAVMIFIGTATTPILNAHSQSIWQSQTPRELQGRVFSVRRVIAQFTVPISTVLAGIFGGVFNPGWVVAALGGLYVIFCVTQLFNPGLLRVEDKAYIEELAASRGDMNAQTQGTGAGTGTEGAQQEVSDLMPRTIPPSSLELAGKASGDIDSLPFAEDEALLPIADGDPPAEVAGNIPKD